MATSGTYTFSLDLDAALQEAFELIGGQRVLGEELQSAKRTANLLLNEWVNRGVNLWLMGRDFIQLKNGVYEYVLPNEVVDSIEMTLREATPVSSGAVTFTPSGANATWAFVSTTDKPMMAALRVSSSTTFNFVVDIDTGSGYVAYTTLDATKLLGEWEYFPIPVVVSVDNVRLRDVNGNTIPAATSGEIFLANGASDTSMRRLGMQEYMTHTQKHISRGKPSLYVTERRRDNVKVNVWPIPDADDTYQLYYWRMKRPEDINTFVENIDIPYRFQPAFVWELAYRLSFKRPGFDPNKRAELLAMSAQMWDAAQEEDRERVNWHITPKLSSPL